MSAICVSVCLWKNMEKSFFVRAKKLIRCFFFYTCRHLVNDGVEETPPHTPAGSDVDREGEVEGDGLQQKNKKQQQQQQEQDDDLFVDLSAANIGFQHWHPVAVTDRGDRLAGQGEMGGVWEWTSSALRRHEGFEPMKLYPGYTG